MTITAKIGKTPVRLRASADTPRLYREEYGRDIFEDMNKLINETSGVIALRCAYVMAKQAGCTQTVGQWLGALKSAPTDNELILAVSKAWLLNLKTLTEPEGEGLSASEDGGKMSAAFFLQSCLSLGIAISELDLLTVGAVTDMLRERGRAYSADEHEACAQQSDFDSF